eukprot:1137360-Pelagomonas_calceolata.AAC.11
MHERCHTGPGWTPGLHTIFGNGVTSVQAHRGTHTFPTCTHTCTSANGSLELTMSFSGFWGLPEGWQAQPLGKARLA